MSFFEGIEYVFVMFSTGLTKKLFEKKTGESSFWLKILMKELFFSTIFFNLFSKLGFKNPFKIKVFFVVFVFSIILYFSSLKSR